MDWVCVLAPTAGSCDSVIAALAHSDTSFSREVAQQTGEEHREHRHRGPANAAVRLRAREGLVGARVLVVAGAVVEQPLDAAHARPVLHGALHRAHAATAAHPAGGESSGPHALGAPAPPAVLALVGVLIQNWTASAARHGLHRSGLIVQGLQLLRVELDAFGLASDELLAARRAVEEPLSR